MRKDEGFGDFQELDSNPDSLSCWLCDLKQIEIVLELVSLFIKFKC